MLALGIVSCPVNQPPGTDISKAGQLSLWKKPHSATPNAESQNHLNWKLLLLCDQGQMHKTCCRFPDLEQES